MKQPDGVRRWNLVWEDRMEDLVRLAREKNIIFVTLACCLLFYMISPRFLSLDNMAAISRQIVPIGLIALGQFFVVVSANIDLSLGLGRCSGRSSLACVSAFSAEPR